eukprot:GHVH01006503.1.p1 GENE.GHVH01006503.1~~GHVH01006503.1.p1  ORF type:complete len:431 (+),score=71.10 GHVH01006503.1:892-2184(+)
MNSKNNLKKDVNQHEGCVCKSGHAVTLIGNEIEKQKEMLKRQEQQITSLNLQIVSLHAASAQIPSLEKKAMQLKEKAAACEKLLDVSRANERKLRDSTEALSSQVSSQFDLQCSLEMTNEALQLAKKQLMSRPQSLRSVTAEAKPLTAVNLAGLTISDLGLNSDQTDLAEISELRDCKLRLESQLNEERVASRRLISELRIKQEAIKEEVKASQEVINRLVVKLSEAGDEILKRERCSYNFLSDSYLRSLELIVKSRWNEDGLLERSNDSEWASELGHSKLLLTLVYGLGKHKVDIEKYSNEIIDVLIQELRKRDLLLTYIIEKCELCRVEELGTTALKSTRVVRLPKVLESHLPLVNDITIATEDGQLRSSLLDCWNDFSLPSSNENDNAVGQRIVLPAPSGDTLRWELYAQELLLDNLRLRAELSLSA